MTTAPDPTPRLPWLAMAATFAIAWLLLGLAAPSQEQPSRFATDEAEYLAMGAISLGQLTGELDASMAGRVEVDDPQSWRDGIHAATFGFQSPGLPKLLFGLTTRFAGIDSTAISPSIYPRFIPKDQPQGTFKATRLAAAEVLLPARASARNLTRTLAALIAALLFAAAARTASHWHPRRTHPITLVAGSLAAALWLASPAVIESAHHIRPGLVPILFWSAGLLLAQTTRAWPLCLALALCLGMAAAGKLNGAIFAPLIPLALFCQGSRGRNLALQTAAAAGLSFVIFVVFAPGLWSDTFAGISEILSAWSDDLSHQAKLARDTVAVPTSRADALKLALSSSFTKGGPGAGLIPYCGALLGLAGFIALAKASRNAAHDRFILAWCCTLYFGSAILLPLDRLRYQTPMAAPLAIVGALLIARLIFSLRARPQQP